MRTLPSMKFTVRQEHMIWLGFCPLCGQPVTKEEFRHDEHAQAKGLCATCFNLHAEAPGSFTPLP